VSDSALMPLEEDLIYCVMKAVNSQRQVYDTNLQCVR